jgi:hypothetical protein
MIAMFSPGTALRPRSGARGGSAGELARARRSVLYAERAELRARLVERR